MAAGNGKRNWLPESMTMPSTIAAANFGLVRVTVALRCKRLVEVADIR